MNLQEIEAVARALYEIQEEGWCWDQETERLKQTYREEARAAIGVLERHDRHIRSAKSAQPLSYDRAEPDHHVMVPTADRTRMH